MTLDVEGIADGGVDGQEYAKAWRRSSMSRAQSLAASQAQHRRRMCLARWSYRGRRIGYREVMEETGLVVTLERLASVNSDPDSQVPSRLLPKWPPRALCDDVALLLHGRRLLTAPQRENGMGVVRAERLAGALASLRTHLARRRGVRYIG